MNSIVHWLCNPVFDFLLLLVSAGVLRLLKRHTAAKYVFIGSIGWVLLAGSSPIPQWMIYSLEKEYRPFEMNEPAARYPMYILVLGGGHIVSPQLPAGIQLSGTATVRLAEAIRIRHLLGKGTLVCSGSSATHRSTQAEILASAAVEMGVPPADTLQQRAPARTAEELRSFQSRFGSTRVIVVSSARHLPRIMMTCRQLGLDALLAPTDFLLKKDDQVSMFEFYPSVHKLSMMESALHEYLGMAKSWLDQVFSR